MASRSVGNPQVWTAGNWCGQEVLAQSGLNYCPNFSKASYIVFHLGVIVYKEDAINTATHLTKTTTTSNQVPLSLSKIISQMTFFYRICV